MKKRVDYLEDIKERKYDKILKTLKKYGVCSTSRLALLAFDETSTWQITKYLDVLVNTGDVEKEEKINGIFWKLKDKKKVKEINNKTKLKEVK